ncbi:MAG: hypothetical protein HYT66_01630 [Candidatus Yanofskybacteria bacterium]|nr:hypothetical protein [Candidatus Yanofskybacteria bacterium]
MKYLRLGLDVPTSCRIGVLILLGIASWLYPPLIYAVVIYYAYFMAWDITSTKSLKIKALKSFMAFYGYILGTSIVLLIFPSAIKVFTDPLAHDLMFKFIIKIFIVYESAVLLFLYIHHCGLHPEFKNTKPT